MYIKQVNRRCFVSPAIFIGVILLSGCSSSPEKQMEAGDVVGTWTLDAKNLSSNAYSIDDFKTFALNIRSDGSFSLAGVPPGIFLNKGAENAAFEGHWNLRYREGYNYINFTLPDLPGYTSGHYGTPFDWKDGRRVIRLKGGGYIYIVRGN